MPSHHTSILYHFHPSPANHLSISPMHIPPMPLAILFSSIVQSFVSSRVPFIPFLLFLILAIITNPFSSNKVWVFHYVALGAAQGAIMYLLHQVATSLIVYPAVRTHCVLFELGKWKCCFACSGVCDRELDRWMCFVRAVEV